MNSALEEPAVNLHNVINEVQRAVVMDAFLLTELCSTAKIKKSHEISHIQPSHYSRKYIFSMI